MTTTVAKTATTARQDKTMRTVATTEIVAATPTSTLKLAMNCVDGIHSNSNWSTTVNACGTNWRHQEVERYEYTNVFEYVSFERRTIYFATTLPP